MQMVLPIRVYQKQNSSWLFGVSNIWLCFEVYILAANNGILVANNEVEYQTI